VELNGRTARLSRAVPMLAAPVNMPAQPAGPVLEEVVKAKQRAEAHAILSALNATRWNRKRAAGLLKVDYKALLYKMKKLGIEDKEAPPPVSETLAGRSNGYTAD